MRRRLSLATIASVAVVTAAAGCLLGSCSAGGGQFAGPPAVAEKGAVTYLALSDHSSLPLPGAASLPASLMAHAFPSWTTAYDSSPGPALPGGASDGGLAELGEAARLAASLHPSVVTVALGMEAALSGTPASVFGGELSSLVRQLRSDGATAVLVANLLPVFLVPGGTECRGVLLPCYVGVSAEAVATYNTEIGSVVRATGARLVNLYGALAATARSHGPASVFTSGSYGLTALGAATAEAAFTGAAKGAKLDRAGVVGR